MNGWADLCAPAKLYLLFMTALVLFNMASGYGRHAMRNTVYGIFGTIALWILCAANMDFAAWGLLALPLFFFIVLIAMWVFDGVLFTTSREFQGGARKWDNSREFQGGASKWDNSREFQGGARRWDNWWHRERPILVTEYKCTQPIGSNGTTGSCTSA